VRPADSANARAIATIFAGRGVCMNSKNRMGVISVEDGGATDNKFVRNDHYRRWRSELHALAYFDIARTGRVA
jgi:hypothetical protein